MIYGCRTQRRPTPARDAAGCPFTGWLHEGQPPWRVIVHNDADRLRRFMPNEVEIVPYDGDERVVDLLDLLPRGAQVDDGTESVRGSARA